MINVRRKSSFLLVISLILLFNAFSVVFLPKPVKAYSMTLDINEPTHIGTKISVVAALVAYMGVRFAVQTSEVKSKVQDWVASGKYALEQTTTGAIKVTNSLIYQLKQSASSLVAQGIATWDSGSGGSLTSGQTINWDSSVASATSFDDVGNYMDVADAVNAINATNDKLDSVNYTMNGLAGMLSSVLTVSANTNSYVQNISDYVIHIPSLLTGIQDWLHSTLNELDYLINMLGGLYNGIQGTLSGINSSLTSINNSIYTLQTNLQTSIGDVKTSVNNVKTSVDGVKTSVNNVKTSVDGVKTAVNTGFSDTVGAIGSMSGTIEGSLENVKTSVDSLPQSIADSFVGTGENVNLEPLKVAGGTFTTRFPFSLPWDLYNSFASLAIDSVKPDFDIDTSSLPLASICGLNKISIDLSDYNDLFGLVKFFELLAFDIGLIFATRKLVGGDT